MENTLDKRKMAVAVPFHLIISFDIVDCVCADSCHRSILKRTFETPSATANPTPIQHTDKNGQQQNMMETILFGICFFGSDRAKFEELLHTQAVKRI